MYVDDCNNLIGTDMLLWP